MHTLSLDIFNNYQVPEINDLIFKEYCEDLDQMDLFIDPEIYLEARVDKSKSIKSNIGTIARNTKDTTSSTLGMYGDLTDAGGAMYKGTFDILSSLARLVTKTIAFLSTRIFEIPTKISKVVNSIESIPSDIKNKIRGNIQLYITAEDLSFFYNKIFFMIVDFINNAEQMSRGESWNTLFSSMKKGKRAALESIFLKSDLKYGDAMKKRYQALKKIEYNPTTIELKNFNTVNIYFGTAEVIDFIDIYGKRHQTTYYDALISLVKEIGTLKEKLKTIQTSVGEKLEKSQLNQTMSDLSPGVQKRIVDNITMISKVINIIGNLVRYILIDMHTIEKHTSKLLKKGKIMMGDPITGKPKDIDTKHIPKVNKNI